MTQHTDLLIIGGGIAGSYAALKASQLGLQVTLVVKTPLQGGSTVLAQGGIAIPLDDADQGKHLKDTLAAGRGLCDPTAVQIFVAEAPERLKDLYDWGVPFATTGTREGGHSQARVYHAYGDATGRAISEILSHAVMQDTRIKVQTAFATQLLLSSQGRVVGVRSLVGHQGLDILAGAVLLATGGAGQLYPNTTAPQECTGDGLALAYRAGAQLRDLEFVQFHPTVCLVQGHSYLITEATRGEGGILRNALGHRFMPEYDPAAELASRDIVAQAVWTEHQKTGQVTLDLTHLGADFVQKRFPNLYRRLLACGFDLACEPIPVQPAAHYTVGGITSTTWGETTLPGLFVAGEVASTGLHGANRLASNSLSEGLVFGYRAVQAAAASLCFESPTYGTTLQAVTPQDFQNLQHMMLQQAGIRRTQADLWKGLQQLPSTQDQFDSITELEHGNLTVIAGLLLAGALIRKESRGSHQREEYPHTNAVAYHTVHQLGQGARKVITRSTAVTSQEDVS